jgi:acetyltransferase
MSETKNTSPNFAVAPANFALEHALSSKGVGRVLLRPISNTDETAMIEFHESISEESIYLRYFEHISLDTRTLHERLARVCTNTPDSFALVAQEVAGGHPRILAVGRLTTTDKPGQASFGLLVSDAAQDTELPHDLLKRLMELARAQGFQTLAGELLVADHDGLNVCRSLHFDLHTVPEDGLVRVTCKL